MGGLGVDVIYAVRVEVLHIRRCDESLGGVVVGGDHPVGAHAGAPVVVVEEEAAGAPVDRPPVPPWRWWSRPHLCRRRSRRGPPGGRGGEDRWTSRPPGWSRVRGHLIAAILGDPVHLADAPAHLSPHHRPPALTCCHSRPRHRLWPRPRPCRQFQVG